jgi:hypothetical protein
MAKKSATQTAEFIPNAMDYKAHEDTYRAFLNLVKWSIVAIAVIVVALFFIVRP